MMSIRCFTSWSLVCLGLLCAKPSTLAAPPALLFTYTGSIGDLLDHAQTLECSPLLTSYKLPPSSEKKVTLQLSLPELKCDYKISFPQALQLHELHAYLASQLGLYKPQISSVVLGYQQYAGEQLRSIMGSSLAELGCRDSTQVYAMQVHLDPRQLFFHYQVYADGRKGRNHCMILLSVNPDLVTWPQRLVQHQERFIDPLIHEVAKKQSSYLFYPEMLLKRILSSEAKNHYTGEVLST